MKTNWSEITRSDQYASLTPDKQEALRNRFFDRVIAPRTPEGKLDLMREKFDQRTLRVVQPQQASTGGNLQSNKALGIAKVAGAGAYTGVLGVAEMMHRVPDAISRFTQARANIVDKGLEYIDAPEVVRTGVNTALSVNPAKLLAEGVEVGGVKIPGMNYVADKIGAVSGGLGEYFEPFKKLQDAGKQAEHATETALNGDYEPLKEVLSNPEAWAGFIGQGIPTFALAWMSGGSLAFMGLLEGLEASSNAAEFEQRTGTKITPEEYTQAFTQSAVIGGLLEKIGFKGVTENVAGFFKSVAKGGVSETATEMGQALNSNLGQKLAYSPEQKLSEGVLASGMGGLGVGGPAAAASSALQLSSKQLKNDDIIEDANEQFQQDEEGVPGQEPQITEISEGLFVNETNPNEPPFEGAVVAFEYGGMPAWTMPQEPEVRDEYSLSDDEYFDDVSGDDRGLTEAYYDALAAGVDEATLAQIDQDFEGDPMGAVTQVLNAIDQVRVGGDLGAVERSDVMQRGEEENAAWDQNAEPPIHPSNLGEGYFAQQELDDIQSTETADQNRDFDSSKDPSLEFLAAKAKKKTDKLRKKVVQQREKQAEIEKDRFIEGQATPTNNVMANALEGALQKEGTTDEADQVKPDEGQEEVQVSDQKQVQDEAVKPDVQPTKMEAITEGANEAATSPTNDLAEPTQPQKEVGNYKKGHISVDGMDITVENPKGSTRSGVDEKGNEWSSEMQHHYGYLKRTLGADGDHVDVFVGDNVESGKVFVVDQVNTGDQSFDEHKVMLGFNTKKEAVEGYLGNYDKGWDGMGSIKEMSTDEFKSWLTDGDTTKPVGKKYPQKKAEKKPVKKKEAIKKEAIKKATLKEQAATSISDEIKPQSGAKAAKKALKKPTKTKKGSTLDNNDVGDELTGNRRSNIGISVADIRSAANDTQKLEMAQKSKIWKRPNYEDMVNNGTNPIVAHLIKQAYDAIGGKVTGNKDADIEAYVEAVSTIGDSIEDVFSSPEVREALLEAEKQLASNTGYRNYMAGMSASEAMAKISDSLLDKVFPKNEKGSRWGHRNMEGNAKALNMGRMFAKKIQFSSSNLRKANEEIAEGWPAKREAWQRSYQVAEEDGKFHVRKKGYSRNLESFDSRQGAITHARTLAATTKKETFKEPKIPLSDLNRLGSDYRQGLDVSTQDLIDTFGFRGVNFGNWMKGDKQSSERQEHVNHIFDAMMDLANVLRLSPKAISLNGMLGVAVGAQGRGGKAAAHFYPGINEINITRASGAGSLAHEWGHALDHHFGNQAGLARSKEPFLSEHYNHSLKLKDEEIRPEIVTAYKALMSAISLTTMTTSEEEMQTGREQSEKRAKSSIESRLSRWRKMIEGADGEVKEFNRLAELIYSGERGPMEKLGKAANRYVGKNISRLRDIVKKESGVKVALDDAQWLDNDASSLNLASSMEEYSKIHKPQQRTRTKYRKGAAGLDKKSKPYWDTPVELFARAFESYALDKINATDGQSDYLVSSWKKDVDGKYTKHVIAAYPQDKEREAINQAFDDLIETIESKETEQGVVLFSKKSSGGGSKLSQDINYNLPKNTIVGGAKEIGELHDYMGELGGAAKNNAVRFAVIGSSEAKYIKEHTGFDLEGYRHVVDLAGMRHTDQYHGNEETEKLRGQLGIGREDYMKIPEIVKNPDKVEYIGKTKVEKLDEIAFSRKLDDGQYYYVTVVRGKKKNLALQSLRKRASIRGAQPAQPATSEDGLALTSETFRSNPSQDKDSIAPNDTPVKKEVPDEDDTPPSLSVNSTKPKGFPVADIEKIVNSISLTGAQVKVVKSVDQIPLTIDTEGYVRGVYHPASKTVYLVADNLNSKSEVEEVLRHEVVGHYAINDILGGDKQDIFDEIQRLKQTHGKIKDYAKTIKATYGELSANDESAEILALMAENGVKMALMTKAIAAVRAWLRQLGFRMPTSEGDIRALIVKAGEYGGANKKRKLSLPVTQKDAVNFIKDIGNSYKKIPTNIDDALKAKRATGEFIGNKVTDFRPKWLTVLTRRHLEDLGKADLPAISAYVKTAQAMDAERNELLSGSAELSEKWQKYIRTNKAEADVLADLMHDTTIAGVDPSVDYKALTDGKETAQKIRVLKEKARGRSGSSTGPFMRQIENEKNKLRQEANRVKAHPELHERWNALSPEAQDIYRQVRDEYLARSNETLEVIMGRIDQYVQDKKHKTKLKETIRFQFESARTQAPYFPLARFGDYWATSFDADENVVEMSMFETQGEQKEWVAEQESKGLDVKRGFKTTKGDMIRSVDSEFVMNVELMVDKSENKDELKDNIYQFYLQTLPDLSMRKSFIHRKQTKGFARDALRAFSHQMFHGSYQLARMKYTPQMEVALKSAEAQVQEAEDPNRAAQIFNELQLRHDWAMNPKGAQWANNVSSFGFTMFLGLSPAAALVNTTQTPLVALPVLGAQFGWDKSSKELLKAAKDYFAGGFNIENSLSGKELKAYQHFIEVGLIDKTLAHDLAGIAEEGGEHSDTRHRVMKVVSFMFHEAEKFNREVTSIAAFRLARQSGHKPEESQNIAEELTWKSHFDYSSGNKARFMQDDKAKVIFMFKQFSLNMSYLLFRNAHQSFKGESKEVRSEALKTITGVLGMHFLFAGALGMPVLLPMVFAIANFIHDDEDEPWDAEVEFRKFLAEYLGNTGGRIIANGLANEVTGIDFASRVSLDGLWVRSSPNDLDGREITTYWGGQLLGPMAGAAGNVAAGLDMVSDGNLQRGIEMMMPVGLKNAMKAVRYNSEGVNSYRGDPVINDVDTSEVFWQAMGFAPSRVGEQYDKNRYIKNKEQRILDRKKLLLNKLSLSINQSDDEFKAEVMESIKKFNSKNPRSAITFDSITRSLKMRKLYSAKSINGINLSNKMRYLAKEVDY